MRGFGQLENLDKLKAFTENIEKKDLIVSDRELTQEQEAALENVAVPMMMSREFGQGKEEEVEETSETEEKPEGASGTNVDMNEDTPEGAAGTSEEGGEEKEPIMGGLGFSGLGLKKEMSRTESTEESKEGLTESFDNEVTDEKPVEDAVERTKDATTVVNDAKNMFNEMFGSNFTKNAEYDLDATKNVDAVISNEPIEPSKLPKWK